jgi:hypothetical protein
VLAVRLVGGDDSLPGDDEASARVAVTPALPVLLVDGQPSLEPLSGATDFLRAALAPTGDDTPQVRATVVPLARLDATALRGAGVVVLAGVDRLAPEQTAAVGRFLEEGGGLLIAPGDRTDTAFFNNLGWMPARLGARKGDPRARRAVAHPAPATFSGPVLAPFGQGDAPPLAEADLFAYHVLSPVAGAGASVLARLDTGDPWAVERPQGRGRVLVLAAGLDARSGTLPVNPDFVPLAHEWVFHLASAPRGGDEDAPDPDRDRESDPAPLEPAEAARLSEGWPLTFETDPVRLESRLFAAERGGRQELWRGLVLAALAGLCLEIYLTRHLLRSQQLGAAAAGDTP